MRFDRPATFAAAACFMMTVMVACASRVDTPPSPRVDHLSCDWPADVWPGETRMTIGPAGGVIRIQNDFLRIPRNALSSPVSFRMRQLTGDSVGVEITNDSPTPVTFASPARLRIDVGSSRCTKPVHRPRWSVHQISNGTRTVLRTYRPILRNSIDADVSSNSIMIIAD